ncbi:SMI1/KNR4 family protein [Halomonas coralii]|uniref:SMI1/KNR4 family protein n=1 Tax=Modicisalibacter sp. R2A 31.J TaxID=2831898 RepID=UPI001CCE0766|nr:SMI1/KNR4 family protein [Modicisalibacter sp. R2A 31.J]MBZ9560089.1 SMI1/KNR4 family protein [Modicisalibacter sp. R2A 31.J]
MLSHMTATGKKLRPEDLSRAEDELGHALPEAYKSFLLKYNGGVPLESYIDFEAEKLKLPGDEIKKFYGLNAKPANDILHKMKEIGCNLPAGLIFIANTHGGNFFLLSLREDSYGEVFYKDHELEDKSPFDPENGTLPESTAKVSRAFREPLNKSALRG